MDWCSSWLPTESNPDYRPSQQQLQLQQQTDALTAIVSESGSAADQVTRITDQIANIFDTSPTRRTGMGCPTRRDCGNCCIERQGNETELQHKSRLLCCLRSPDETNYRDLKPNIKPLPKPNLPLAPPSRVPGGMIPDIDIDISPDVARYCNKNNEIIIQEDGTRTTIRGDNICCVSECIENTWHKKCGTNQDDFRSIPGDVWSSDYLSQENLGVPCSQSQPCFMRNGTMYDCNNPPSGGGGGGGGGSGDGSQYGTVRPNIPRF
jgi:hypothetical protein